MNSEHSSGYPVLLELTFHGRDGQSTHGSLQLLLKWCLCILPSCDMTAVADHREDLEGYIEKSSPIDALCPFWVSLAPPLFLLPLNGNYVMFGLCHSFLPSSLVRRVLILCFLIDKTIFTATLSLSGLSACLSPWDTELLAPFRVLTSFSAWSQLIHDGNNSCMCVWVSVCSVTSILSNSLQPYGL